MIASNGIKISVTDCFGRREDGSFINEMEWESPDHVREAIKVWLASRLAAVAGEAAQTVCVRSDSLCDDELEQIRMRLASNPQSPPAVLSYLAKMASATLLERIAENPRTPAQLLEELATNPLSNVRAAVADNPSTPKEVLELLLSDADADVRYRLAENANLSEELLTRLCAEDANPYVAARASATLARLSCGRVFRGDFLERAKVRVVAFR
jgi:hypothetical protein